jgi:hypothetical protein
LPRKIHRARKIVRRRQNLAVALMENGVQNDENQGEMENGALDETASQNTKRDLSTEWTPKLKQISARDESQTNITGGNRCTEAQKKDQQGRPRPKK